MSERTRILKLVEDGKITPDEATMLLEALAEVEAPRPGLGYAPPVPPLPPHPPEPPQDWARGRRRLERLTEAARQLGVGAEEMGRRVAEEFGGEADEPVMVSYPSHLRWFKVQLMDGDLEVVVEPGRQRPWVEGEVELVERGGDLVVQRARGRRRRGIEKISQKAVEKVMEKLFGEGEAEARFVAHDDLRVRLPEGWGLACEVYSGDLSVEGVPFVRGRVLSGDAVLRGVGGVDLLVASGDLEAELRLVEGQHNLELLHGDAHVVFLDSSVQVEGQLLNGELDPRGHFEQRGRRVLGTVGGGHAHLRLLVRNGDLTLEDQSHHEEVGEV